MKKIKYLLLAAAMIAGFGCTKVYDDYTPGAPDDENTFGVYFPTQSTTTTLELEPESNTNAVYRIQRTRTDEAIDVPIRVEVWKSVADEVSKKTEWVAIENQRIFSISPIHFDNGQRETEFKVEFPRAELGIEYKVTITIDDPAYVSTYAGKDTAFTFTVLRASWKYLGKGYWRDDFFSSVYVNVPNAYAEVEVDIYERDDQPGIYRMKVFNKAYIMALFEGAPNSTDENTTTIIDASDPEKVWIPLQDTKISLAADHGTLVIASNVDKIFSMDASDSQYGTLEEGIITFPVHGLLGRLTGVDSDNEWRGLNGAGMFRLRLPGSRIYDYSFEIARNEEDNNAALSVDITYPENSDVAVLKYGVVEGRISDEGQASLTAQSFDTGELKYDGTLQPSQNRLSITPKETGIYTLICCSYDARGQMQDFRYLPFGYVADGDEQPVAITFGLELTNEKIAQGFDKTNSMKFYLYGEDAYAIRYALRRNDRTDKDMSDKEIIEEFGYEMTAQELEQVNSDGFSHLFTNLNGNCEYTLYLEVDNGYNANIFKETVKTEGKYNPILDGWSFNDFRNVDVPSYKQTVVNTTYNLYGFDLLNQSNEMIYLGEVTVYDEDDPYTDDMINIRGLMSSIMIDDGKGEDEHHRRTLIPAKDVMIPGGYDLYSMYSSPRYGIFSIASIDLGSQNNGKQYEQDIYLIFYAEETLSGYVGNGGYILYGMTAGEVADGCLAITPCCGFADMNMTYRFMGFVGQGTTYALYMNLILVDKTKDIGLPKNPPMLNDILSMVYESEDVKGGALPWSAPANHAPATYDNDITPYTKNIMHMLNPMTRNRIIYPQIPAEPAKVKKAVTDSNASVVEKNGSNGEMPAMQLGLAKTRKINARLN